MRVLTISSLAPLALPTLPRPIVERLVAHLRDAETFALPYPVPSVSAREPSFMPGDAHGRWQSERRWAPPAPGCWRRR